MPGTTQTRRSFIGPTFRSKNPVSDAINAICLINKKAGWACGNNGLVLKYDGQTWTKVATGLGQNENFMSIGFYNESEGWIGGTHGIILHYKNGQWVQDASPSTEVLYSIAVTRSRTVWAAGSTGTMLIYNGISWAPVSIAGASSSVTLNTDIYSIGLSDQNSGWGVGNQGLLLKYDGQKWASVLSPTTERLNSVSVLSDVQAWAVGAFGSIINFNGTTWTKAGSAFSGFDLYNVTMKDDSDGWLCGQDGTIAFYDGTRWISHVKPDAKPSLNAMAFYKDTGFMAGQNGTILKFQVGGAPTKYDFTFKSTVPVRPTKANPYWAVTYTILNQSPKTTVPIDFILPIPKGFEPYQPKVTPTPGGAVADAAVVFTPTPIVSPVATSTAPTVKPTTAAPAIPLTTGWTVKDDNLDWELGTIASAGIKTITVQLSPKKGQKREFPVVLSASLKTVDRTVAEAAPVTMFEPTPVAVSTSSTTPLATPNTAAGGANAKPAVSQ